MLCPQIVELELSTSLMDTGQVSYNELRTDHTNISYSSTWNETHDCLELNNGMILDMLGGWENYLVTFYRPLVSLDVVLVYQIWGGIRVVTARS